MDYNTVYLTGFDNAIVGYTEVNGHTVVVYSREKCIDILMEDMSEDEAIEYFYYKIVRALSYIGEIAPVFIRKDIGIYNQKPYVESES